MSINLLLENLTNPALLFFILGIIAGYFKIGLNISENSSEFVSLYLMFVLGFKGGYELTGNHDTTCILPAMVFGFFICAVIPLYLFFKLKQRLNV